MTELIDCITDQSDVLNRKLGEALERVGNESHVFAEKLDQLREGINHQSDLLNRKLGELLEGAGNQVAQKFDELREGINNQSDLLNRKLGEVAEGVSHQSDLLNRKLGEMAEGAGNQVARKFDEVREGIDNQSDLLNRKLGEVAEGIGNQSDLLNRKLDEVAEGVSNQSDLLNRKLGEIAEGVGNQSSVLERKFDELGEGVTNQSDLLNRKLGELAAGIDNQSGVLGRKFDQLGEGIDNQSDLLNRKLGEVAEGVGNQSELLNRKLGEVAEGVGNQSDLLNRKLGELAEGLDNQSDLLNRKFEQLFEGQDNQSDLINRKFEQLVTTISKQSDTLNSRFRELISETETHTPLLRRALTRTPSGPAPPSGSNETSFDNAPVNSFRDAMQRAPLLIDDRTYNTNHPDYDARLVRNYPGKILNRHGPCTSFAYAEFLRLANGDEIPDGSWDGILSGALDEARAIPGADQVFERRAFIEDYMAELDQKYDAIYVPGWINLHDAVFLYWLVRQTRPDKIVQCGACNGLSSAFMMLGMVKNGPEGTLSIIDLPPIFNADDPKWTERGKAHGVCIPAGKTTAWMVPDTYRDRLEIWNGDAKDLLPSMIDKLASVDFFYHDSDHTYRHMIFEFEQAKRKLSRGGVIVADDISWNASLWDFADNLGAPAYNFRGTMGVAFF